MFRAAAAATMAVVCLAASYSPAFGQSRPRRVEAPETSDARESVDEGAPTSLEGTLVEVPVVVADRSGRYVPNLARDDFELYEDDQLQEITSFESDRVPIHVAILMDASSSTEDSLDDIREAAADFVDLLLPGDEIMVVVFNDKVRVEQSFTNDRGKLKKAVRKAKTQKGTKLYDAVYESVASRMRGVEGRKAVILLSDGDDTRSDKSFDEAVDVCGERDITVYGIRYPKSWTRVLHMPGKKGKGWGIPRLPGIPKIPGVNWPLAQSWRSGGGDFMEVVTHDTGGTLYNANAISDLRGLLARIAEELRHVYVLGYSPSNPLSNGGYRKISVRVPAAPDLAVKHRLGYKP